MNEIKAICFEDEVELKKYLAKDKYFYGVLGCTDMYIITFRDNKAGTSLATCVVESPIVGIRRIGSIIQEVKLPIEDIDIQLVLCYNATDNTKKPVVFPDYVTLSPYLYYKKKEINGSNVIQSKEQN